MSEAAVSAPTATPAPAPNQNMTGEEAVAWVEAQKAGKVSPQSSTPKKGEKTEDPIKEAVAEAKRKLKIDDEEVDEEEVLKVYKNRKGHQQAANKELQEGKALRKQAEEFIAMMRDPDKFFDVAQKLGHDPRTLAEKKLAAYLEDEIADPRELELKKTKEELKALKAREEEIKRQEEEKLHLTLQEKYAKDYSDQFVAALQESGLPPTKPMVAEMAKYIQRAAKIGFQMTAAEAANLVKEDVQIAHQKLIGDADGEMLIKLLGENVANKVRKWDTGRIKNPEHGLTTPQDQPETSRRASRHSDKRMSRKEWREYNRR